MRAYSKHSVNRTGLKLSPCRVPTLLVDGFDVEVLFIRVSMTVPLRRSCITINLCSSSSTIDFTISRRWRLFIVSVSKATDISMSQILIVVSSFSAFAANHLCVHKNICGASLRSESNLIFLTGIPHPVILSGSG